QLFATFIAESLTVRGEVRGNITARSRVAVGKTGRLTGDVDAPSVSIEGGAVVSGFFRIGPNSR
ncbi:MAG: polymer-forming cytoskeletal protein, partial [Phycisphaerales bacterium]